MKTGRTAAALLAVIFAFIFFSCSDDGLSPQDSTAAGGLSGTIVDTSGSVLSGVKIYCLFYMNSQPTETSALSKLSKTSEQNSFPFMLYQNFPNPVFNDAFFRFSVPSDGEVSLMVTDKSAAGLVYNYTEKVTAGLYQYGIRGFVDSLKLRNGFYDYLLNFKSASGQNYSDSKRMFVLSTKGSPNCISNYRGFYFFDYRDICAGDTVVNKQEESWQYNTPLTNDAYLWITKEGYDSRIIQVSLINGKLLNRDIVMTKMH